MNTQSDRKVPRDVIVVGGGFSGLLTAIEFSRRGISATVVEASDQAGGVARTVREDGYVLEPAAGTFLLPHPELSPLLHAAGVDLVESPSTARRRWAFRHGAMHELKDSPAIAFSPVLSWKAKFRTLREPWIHTPPPAEDESLLHFACRRLGPETGQLIANIMAHGVFAGDPSAMSARAAFAKLVALEDEAGSLIRGGIQRMRARPKGTPRATAHTAPDGMASVAQTLAEFLGDRYKGSWPVTSVHPEDDRWVVDGPERLTADAIVIALAPAAAANIVPDDIAPLLGDRPTANVAIVGLGGRASDMPIPPGFGFLTGPGESIHALGMLFESEYAANRAPDGCRMVKAIYGGDADPHIMRLSDDELLNTAIDELSLAIGTRVRPEFTRVVRQESGIPQYKIGHPAWLRQLDTALVGHPGLQFTGWGYRGIGVSSLATDAVHVVDELTHHSSPAIGILP